MNGAAFCRPFATHAAGTSSSTSNIMGMRLRLKSSFDLSSYSATNQVILKAMQQYGLIVADNGSNMYSRERLMRAGAMTILQPNPVGY